MSRDLGRGLCVGTNPDLFYPTDEFGKELPRNSFLYLAEPALELCRSCPVKDICLDNALGRESATIAYGVAGNMIPHDRKRLKAAITRAIKGGSDPLLEYPDWYIEAKRRTEAA